MEIKVLGTGCSRCKKLYEEAEKAIRQSGINASLIKVDRIEDIMAYKVLSTPALVINGEVKCAGKIPSASEIAGWLRSAREKG